MRTHVPDDVQDSPITSAEQHVDWKTHAQGVDLSRRIDDQPLPRMHPIAAEQPTRPGEQGARDKRALGERPVVHHDAYPLAHVE